MEDVGSGYRRSSPLVTSHSEVLKLQHICPECLLHASHKSKCLSAAVNKQARALPLRNVYVNVYVKVECTQGSFLWND